MSTVERLTVSAESIVQSYEALGAINRIDGKNLPTFQIVIEILNDLMQLLFPGYFGGSVPTAANLRLYIQSSTESLHLHCIDVFSRALQAECKLADCSKRYCDEMAEECSFKLLESLPDIRSMLKDDVAAGYDGDPAAKSHEEVILCYPFIYAIAAHRIAHELYKMEIPLIPRMMSEWAHRRTGIDIHPGATIGHRFFIDHGTGAVIGETTVIGNDVKLYQGVTLGALSFPKNPDGTVVKGGKRHPTLLNNVTVYAGATILGGKTVIGENCIIGSNTWITESVPPNTLVTFQQQQTRRTRNYQVREK